MLMAKRGYVYKWVNPNADGHSNYCVVVSEDHRCTDNIVSILFITTDRGQFERDTVHFKFNKQTWMVRTDLVTYTKREYLVEKITNVPDSVMKDIDNHIVQSLGLNVRSSDIPWEEMYNNLLMELIKRGDYNE